MTRAFDHDLVRRFATRAVHAGQAPDPLAGAVMTPIYQTSTYIQDGLGRNKGYEYARTRNPTREALERNVAALEGGRHGWRTRWRSSPRSGVPCQRRACPSSVRGCSPPCSEALWS